MATALAPASFSSLFGEHAHLGLRTCLADMGGFSTPRLPARAAWADFQHTALYPGRLRQGSGRAVFYEGHYLKGVGRTALAANWTLEGDTLHATGHLAPSAGARELLISHYMKCKGLSDTIVPCEGLLVAAMETGFAAAYTASMASDGCSVPTCDRALQAISVKGDDFARWSNLVWLANQMPAQAESVIAWCSLAGHFAAERSGASSASTAPSETGSWTAREVAESLARAARRAIETLAIHVRAGVTWSSYHNNSTLDGRFLDLELPTVIAEPVLCRFVISHESLSASQLPHHGVLFGMELLFEAQQIRVAVRTLIDRFRLLRSVAVTPSVAQFLEELECALEEAFGERHWVTSREQQRQTLTSLFEDACVSTSRARRAADEAMAEFYEEDGGETDVAGRLLPLALPAPEPGGHVGVYLLDGGRCLESARARDERGAFLTSIEQIEACSTPERFLDCVREGLKRIEAATAPTRRQVLDF
ncbi:MAG: hypothetical protein ACRBN8_21195 [Nannocystales bacterium]